MPIDRRSDILRLQDLKGEMLSCINQAERIMRRIGGLEYERARSYWVAHIKIALTNDNEYVAGCSMEDTIKELKESR